MLDSLVQNNGNKNIYKRLNRGIDMAISSVSIDTIFSALNSWDESIGESSKWYAAHVEQISNAEEPSLTD